MRRLVKALKKVLMAGSIAFVLLLIATASGLGYQVEKFDVDYTSRLEIDQVKFGLLAHIRIWLNPFLFPVSCVFSDGTEVSSDFMFVVYESRGVRSYEKHGVFDSGSNPFISSTTSEFAEAVASIVIFSELGKNVPVYFVYGLLFIYLTEKFLERLRGKNIKEFSELTTNQD